MNQHNEYITISTEEEPEIDLRDLFAGLLLRWKQILACILVCALLGCGVAFLRATTPASLNDRLENARAQLTEEQAADVESLHARYVGYQEYQRSLQDNYTRYLSNAARADSYILLHASYYLSSVLEGLDVILPQMVLSEEDYSAFRSVCAEEEDFSSIYNRVKITCSRSVAIPAGSSTVITVNIDDNPLVNYYVLITLYGSSEEECEEMLTIVDRAMKRYVSSLRALDSNIMLNSAEKEYTRNTRDFIKDQVNAEKAILNDIESQMLSLTNNRIVKLSSAEKNYYELLSEVPQDDAPSGKQVSWKKWTAVGAFLGLFLGAGIYCLMYLFNGKIKTPEDAELLFRTHTLQRISLPGKKNLFGSWAAALVGADSIASEEKTELLAADILPIMEKSGHQKLFLLCDPRDQNAFSLAEMLKQRLEERSSSFKVAIGNPLSSAAELKEMSESDGAVVFTELKSSSGRVQKAWSELCARHQCSIIGIVAAEICW